MTYTPTELARIRAASDILHWWVHDPERTDPDCIVGVYTAEEVAYSLVCAGWAPQAMPVRGWTAKVGLWKPGTWAWALSQIRPAREWMPTIPDLLAELDDPHDYCGPECCG